MSRTFASVLEQIRKESKNVSELGSKFEKITKDFLETDSHYASRFKKIWLWKNWPERDGPDTGIDIIAKEQDDSLCAIQCKCYAEDGGIDTKAVSKFLAKAAALGIKNIILVYTGDYITPNAKRLLEQSRCAIIESERFEASSIDWSKFPKLTKRKPKKLRPHQQKALSDVIEGFGKHDRGKMIMACGTGKTLAALHIAEKMVSPGCIVLYLVPSISLILQSMREWSDNANTQHYYVAVCSDKSVDEGGSITELESPVSTKVDELVPYIKKRPKNAMTVIFSTYHSIRVAAESIGNEKFALIFCDEAHRTTGIEDKSFFTVVHENSNVPGIKRLYMTATPKVYSDVVKEKTDNKIYSMDDEKKYGPEFHRLSFTNAVKQDILSDFKVKVAVVPESFVSAEFTQSIADDDSTIPLSERTLLLAAWHGLQYPDDDETEPNLLQRVIAFSNRIDRSQMFAGEIRDPNDHDRSFKGIVDEYRKIKPTARDVEVRHIDGKTRALERHKEMRWLNSSHDNLETCHILSNARCLSEGVDVPALDGVIFLNPRKSRVDVVQAVGRVMRKSPGKKFGYVILPVAVPTGVALHESLDNNKTWQIVWQVLNALRSHDEDFAREINTLILDKNGKKKKNGTPRISISILDVDTVVDDGKFFSKVKSKLVEKVGDINYYDKYGQKIGRTAKRIEDIIRIKIEHDLATKAEIKRFHNGLQSLINRSVTEDQTIQATAQHMVMSRIFDALFKGEFTSHNPISIAFENMIKKVKMDEELEELEDFYDEVQKELDRINTREERQNFIKKIYGNFFESADKKGAEKHGIVYTPVEVIDFIIQSVQHVLNENFGVGFDDRAVKVMEPFAGTGTFLTRLLESGLITNNLYKKYRDDLFANEIMLLAYYVATVNIETTYSSLRGGRYAPFEGISYADTLEQNPQYLQDARHRHEESKIDAVFEPAHKRIRRQRSTNVDVIIGNPPYSMSQSSFSEQNQNISYPTLDERIEKTYIVKTKKVRDIQQTRSLYDSYVRSIRWASDRIGESGIIGFITNANFIRSDTAAGIRACLAEEFNEIWCFDLRGNARTHGEMAKQEGENIFETGSRLPIAITILVKNPKKKGCVIRYKNIGDYHSREEKLKIIRKSGSISGIKDWQVIEPDKHYDWIEQRTNNFNKYLLMGGKKNEGDKEYLMFEVCSNGIKTHRDSWTYNSSKRALSNNIKIHIDYCNEQNLSNPIMNPKRGKWTGELSDKLKRHALKFDNNKIRISLYRLFFKQHLYYDNILNDRRNQIPKFFPKENSINMVIIVPDKGRKFSVFITNITPDLHIIEANQCFALYIYEDDKRIDNITDPAHKQFQKFYYNEKITKQDIFWYVYGILHHPGYRTKYANNLKRELPRIPMAPDFQVFKDTGKRLANLHLNFETCPRYDMGKPLYSPSGFRKLAFSRIKNTKTGKKESDKTKIMIDGILAFENIPEVKYQVNGRTPLEWIVDRYRITQDKESGIINNPCTGVDIIAVIERAVYVGVESDRIIATVPKEFEPPEEWTPSKSGLDKYVDAADFQSKL